MQRPVIYFDWDGTIADSMPLCVGEIALAYERMGLPAPPVELMRACNGPTFEESVHVLGLPEDRAEEYLRLRAQAEMELVPTLTHPFPGIPDMLAQLSAVADLAVISNGLQAYLDLCLRTFCMESVFVRVQGCIPGSSKGDTLGLMLREMHPGCAIMVGDRLGDILAGKQNGLPTVAAGYGFGNEDEYAQADHRADSPAAMTQLLRQLIHSAL